MKIGFISLSVPGHFNPMSALARQLQSRNHAGNVNDFGQQVGLEFKDNGRLTEFLAKMGERFPDSGRETNAIFSGGDRVIGEWTQTEASLDGQVLRKGNSKSPRRRWAPKSVRFEDFRWTGKEYSTCCDA